MKTNKTPSTVVVDHFFDDPDAVREYALKQTYAGPAEHGAVGYRCELGRKIFDGTKEAIETIMGRKVVEGNQEGGWGYSTNGCFQWCAADIPKVYHCDSQMYAGAVYLTPDAPREAGTSFYRHRETGIDWMPSEEDCKKYFNDTWAGVHGAMFGKYDNLSANFLDGTLYEKTDEVSNIYNRLVLWDARKIHAASAYFGDNIHNSRLFQVFFFDLEEKQ